MYVHIMYSNIQGLLVLISSIEDCYCGTLYWFFVTKFLIYWHFYMLMFLIFWLWKYPVGHILKSMVCPCWAAVLHRGYCCTYLH